MDDNGSCVECRKQKQCLRCGRVDRNEKGICYCLDNTEYRRTLRFNITVEEQHEMLKNQNNCCAACGIEMKSGKGTNLDHNHNTGEIREFLCLNCNVAIGYLQDSSSRAELLAAYLKRHGC